MKYSHRHFADLPEHTAELLQKLHDTNDQCSLNPKESCVLGASTPLVYSSYNGLRRSAPCGFFSRPAIENEFGVPTCFDPKNPEADWEWAKSAFPMEILGETTSQYSFALDIGEFVEPVTSHVTEYTLKMEPKRP